MGLTQVMKGWLCSSQGNALLLCLCSRPDEDAESDEEEEEEEDDEEEGGLDVDPQALASFFSSLASHGFIPASVASSLSDAVQQSTSYRQAATALYSAYLDGTLTVGVQRGTRWFYVWCPLGLVGGRVAGCCPLCWVGDVSGEKSPFLSCLLTLVRWAVRAPGANPAPGFVGLGWLCVGCACHFRHRILQPHSGEAAAVCGHRFSQRIPVTARVRCRVPPGGSLPPHPVPAVRVGTGGG